LTGSESKTGAFNPYVDIGVCAKVSGTVGHREHGATIAHSGGQKEIPVLEVVCPAYSHRRMQVQGVAGANIVPDVMALVKAPVNRGESIYIKIDLCYTSFTWR